MSRTFAIGDIHGCNTILQPLLASIDPKADDTLIFLGDMIDRGEDSKGVLDTVMSYQKKCHVIIIMGNHEEMLLSSLYSDNYFSYWLRYGGKETLESFNVSIDVDGLWNIDKKYIELLKNARPYYENDVYIFAHATPDANTPMHEQNEEDLRWRFIKDGSHQHISGKKIICGHSSQKSGEVLAKDGLICIDTYAHGGFNLTALEIETMIAWQINKRLEIEKMAL